MENKLSFFKRIALTKSELFTSIQSDDLDKAGNNKSGYYSIKTIMLHLNPIMTKYDLDFDIIVNDKLARFIWFDCDSDKTREVTLELKPMSEIDRLASMQNIVQSGGAVLSYYKRYLLTTALNLNSTDLIENSPSNQGNKNQQKVSTQKQGQPEKPEEKPPVLVNKNQLTAMFAVMGRKGISDKKMKESFEEKYKINSSKLLTVPQYNDVMKYLNGLKDKPKDKPKEAKKETTAQSEGEKIQR